MMTDAELMHYSRQLLLADIDVEGQIRLNQSHVIVLGLGGLGSPVALYLGAAGVGRLTLVDGDIVDQTNLHRQIIHSQSSLNAWKVDSAQNRIQGLNPYIQVDVVREHANEKNMVSLVPDTDCIADCTDSFATRFLANRLALMHKRPVVSAAALGLEGQLTTIDPRSSNHPCYACLVPDVPEVEMTCSETGVLGPLVGALGTLQAVEIIGILLNWPDRLVGRLLRFHAKSMNWKSFRYQKDPECSTCGSARKL